MMGNVSIGSTTGKSTLHIEGTIGLQVETLSSNTTAGNAIIYLVDASNRVSKIILSMHIHHYGARHTLRQQSGHHGDRLWLYPL